MDIAALSAVMANQQVRQQAGIAIVAKAMDVAETESQELIRMMERSVTPELGSQIDIRL